MPGLLREPRRGDPPGRVASDVIRFHQAGTVSGWIEIEGERHEVKPEDWYGFRDRVGACANMSGSIRPTWCRAATAPPAATRPTVRFTSTGWSPKSTGPTAPAMILPIISAILAGRGRPLSSAVISTRATGGKCRSCISIPRSITARLTGARCVARVTAIIAGKGKSVEERVFEIEVINPEMGFRLLPGMYGEWKGQIHGSFKGEAFLDGETIDDVNNPAKLAETYRWQIRDRPVRIREGANRALATWKASFWAIIRGCGSSDGYRRDSDKPARRRYGRRHRAHVCAGRSRPYPL